MRKTGLTVIVIAVFLTGCATTPAPQEQSVKLEQGKEYSVEVLETVENFGFFAGYALIPFTGTSAMDIDPGLVKTVNDKVRSDLEERGLLIRSGQKIVVSGEILSASFEGARALMKAKIQLADAHNELPLSTVVVGSRGLDRTGAREALSLGIVEYLSGIIEKE